MEEPVLKSYKIEALEERDNGTYPLETLRLDATSGEAAKSRAMAAYSERHKDATIKIRSVKEEAAWKKQFPLGTIKN